MRIACIPLKTSRNFLAFNLPASGNTKRFLRQPSARVRQCRAARVNTRCLLLAAIVTALEAGAFAWSVAAESIFEKLVTPGELIEGHAKFKKTCATCHSSFSKGAQTQLCLDCHKPLAADFSAKTGFHGNQPRSKTRYAAVAHCMNRCSCRIVMSCLSCAQECYELDASAGLLQLRQLRRQAPGRIRESVATCHSTTSFAAKLKRQ